MKLCIQTGGKIIPIDKMIEEELDRQFDQRYRLSVMEEHRQFNSAYQSLKRSIENSCERVRNYYDLKDGHGKTIGSRKLKLILQK